MVVMVVGLGSMGKRRIRLLRKYDAECRIIGVDSNEQRRIQVEKEYGIVGCSSIEEACKIANVEYAFVSTSPLSHAAIINKCLKMKMHVFTELNLVDTMYDENMELASKENRVLFLSSTFLYRKEMEYMEKSIRDLNTSINYVYHVGQYLPDWHPWENYKDFFVGKKETNGCREFMAIELPWLINVFGKVKHFNVSANKISNLELDYPDNYLLLLEHECGNKGVVALDIVSRKASRNLEVFGEEIYFKWQGTPDSLYVYDYTKNKDMPIKLYDTVDKREDYCASIIEDAYYSEIINFFEVVQGKDSPRYSFDKDKDVIQLINTIEKSIGEK